MNWHNELAVFSPVQKSVAHDEALAVVGLELPEAAAVHQATDDGEHGPLVQQSLPTQPCGQMGCGNNFNYFSINDRNSSLKHDLA